MLHAAVCNSEPVIQNMWLTSIAAVYAGLFTSEV